MSESQHKRNTHQRDMKVYDQRRLHVHACACACAQINNEEREEGALGQRSVSQSPIIVDWLVFGKTHRIARTGHSLWPPWWLLASLTCSFLGTMGTFRQVIFVNFCTTSQLCGCFETAVQFIITD
jgi:hypothetical protein